MIDCGSELNQSDSNSRCHFMVGVYTGVETFHKETGKTGRNMLGTHTGTCIGIHTWIMYRKTLQGCILR